VFIRREDTDRFIEEVRGDDPELASYLRIEEREVEAGGLNQQLGATLCRLGSAAPVGVFVLPLSPARDLNDAAPVRIGDVDSRDLATAVKGDDAEDDLPAVWRPPRMYAPSAVRKWPAAGRDSLEADLTQAASVAAHDPERVVASRIDALGEEDLVPGWRPVA
jgi:hypothetical protein